MKPLKLLAVFVLIFSIIVPSVTAVETKVILVSDNEADKAIADAVANVKDIQIFVTPWGEYNESLVSTITLLNPTEIIILGGTSSVPDDYESYLNFTTVIRISGPDRFVTAAKAVQHFKQDFIGKGIVIAYGYDSKGIQNALQKAKKMGGIVLFVRQDDVPEEVEWVINATDSEIEIEESPDMDSEKIRNKIKEKVKKEVKINAIDKEERTTDQIEDSERELEKAQNMNAELNLTSDSISILINNSLKHLEEAKDAYDNESYGKAFGQAVAAEHLAENALRLMDRYSEIQEGEGKIQEKLQKKLQEMEKKLKKLENKIKKKEQKGVDTSIVNEYYEMANENLREAKDLVEDDKVGDALEALEEKKNNIGLANAELENLDDDDEEDGKDSNKDVGDRENKEEEDEGKEDNRNKGKNK